MRDLRGRYAIAGIGETEYSRASGRSTRALGVEAVRLAIIDAGLAPRDIDGMLSYHSNDSTPSVAIAADLGIRLNTYADVIGGGSSTEGLVAYAESQWQRPSVVEFCRQPRPDAFVDYHH